MDFTRKNTAKSFFGRVSHIYHENPPVNWTKIEGDLKPRCLPPVFGESLDANQFTPILYNGDVQISVATLVSTDDHFFFRNADFDELFFIHDGEGKFETIYGHLTYKKGDYIIIPRGTTYKQFISSKTKCLKVESRSEFEDPSRGILGQMLFMIKLLLELPKLLLAASKI